METTTEEREYTVRITRHPLTEEQISEYSAAGVLAQDFMDRSVEAVDFVRVTAPRDGLAASRAMMKTKLKFAGESVTYDEHLGGGEFRPLSATDPRS